MSNLKPEDTIKNLEKLAQEGFEIIENINIDATVGLKIHDLYYSSIFDMILNNFESLNTVSVLVKHKKFKDCFTLLRTVFESMLYFWLVVDGKKHQLHRQIQPDGNESAKEARDETYALWHKQWNETDPDHKKIIDIQKVKNNEIVIVEHVDSYMPKDKEKINDYIPYYYFVLTNQYNPFVKNSNLPSIQIGDFMSQEQRSEQRYTQKTLWDNYIRPSAIWDNLRLNDLITDEQLEYIRIHYSYLSNYVHTTKEFFQFTKGSSLLQKSDVPESIVIEQIWLYVCRIQCKLLRILVERIKKYNPNASMTCYIDLIQRMDVSTSHFWFFDNEPTAYDIRKSESRKNMSNRINEKQEDNDDMVWYNEDPVQRLHEYRYWLQSQNKDMNFG